MDPRLLHYYNVELQHLREMGAEFAQQFPKIAARLGMEGIEVADPYVERLLEGVAFMASRVQLKLDAEFPRFTQALLEMIYPHYLAPTPSMLIAQLQPDLSEPNLARGFTIPRGSAMHSSLGKGDMTACEFRTAQDVTVWPIEITAASYFFHAPDLPLNSLAIRERIKGGVRLKLRSAAGLKFNQLATDRLCFYLSGRDDVANKLYELCFAAGVGVLVQPAQQPASWHELLPATAIRPVGFDDDQALLPVTLRSFQGYRILQEYFSFPQRFRFVEIAGLAKAFQRSTSQEIELVILFARGEAQFESVVDAKNFSLFCTPAINLFPKRTDRIHITQSAHEYHVVADRTQPMDHEIYEVKKVVGHGVGADSEQHFLPFYAAYSSDEERQSAYFTVRREPRLASSAQKKWGARSSYIGTEVFISLVDPMEAPFNGDLRQLSLETLCTNRDLVLQMPLGLSGSDFALDIAAPVVAIKALDGPSRPFSPLAHGSVSWRAISHLSLNYLSLMNSTEGEGAAALRDMLELYAVTADAAAKRQIAGIKSVHVNPVVRRLRGAGPLAFGRGLEITVDIEEFAFEGGSAFLLGAVLEHFFARHVSINSFTETALRSQNRGEIHRWAPQWGMRPIL